MYGTTRHSPLQSHSPLPEGPVKVGVAGTPYHIPLFSEPSSGLGAETVNQRHVGPCPVVGREVRNQRGIRCPSPPDPRLFYPRRPGTRIRTPCFPSTVPTRNFPTASLKLTPLDPAPPFRSLRSPPTTRGPGPVRRFGSTPVEYTRRYYGGTSAGRPDWPLGQKDNFVATLGPPPTSTGGADLPPGSGLYVGPTRVGPSLLPPGPRPRQVFTGDRGRRSTPPCIPTRRGGGGTHDLDRHSVTQGTSVWRSKYCVVGGSGCTRRSELPIRVRVLYVCRYDSGLPHLCELVCDKCTLGYWNTLVGGGVCVYVRVSPSAHYRDNLRHCTSGVRDLFSSTDGTPCPQEWSHRWFPGKGPRTGDY